MPDDALRTHLVRLLTWQDAHVSFERAVNDLAPSLRGRRPTGAPYSAWQLLEHLRITQRDILDFCRKPEYVELSWPEDYWPKAIEPSPASAWEQSVESYLNDRADLVLLANDPSIDLFATIPHGSGQTYLRELLLVADHNAYHVGEIVLVRRILGAWPAA